MAFDVLKFLTTILGGLGIAGIEQKIIDKANETRTEYPDLEGQIDAMLPWFQETIAPYLDPTYTSDTLRGILTTVLKGQGGSDPKAWQTSV